MKILLKGEIMNSAIGTVRDSLKMRIEKATVQAHDLPSV